jgi:hypothetical protein
MLLRQSVNKLSQEMEWDLRKAFERVGCSCHPLRQKMEQVQAECNRLRLELEQAPPFRRFTELKNKVAEIDAKEHPDLNRTATQAVHFFRVWLFQRLASGNAEELGDHERLAIAYARDWLNGWRPALKK